MALIPHQFHNSKSNHHHHNTLTVPNSANKGLILGKIS
jgi:hypothetical protein